MKRLICLVLCMLALSGGAVHAQQSVTIRAGKIIDDLGSARSNVVITVRGTRIEKNAPYVPRTAATYNFWKYTVLPGLIDSNVHIDSNFGAAPKALSRVNVSGGAIAPSP